MEEKEKIQEKNITVIKSIGDKTYCRFCGEEVTLSSEFRGPIEYKEYWCTCAGAEKYSKILELNEELNVMESDTLIKLMRLINEERIR